MKPSYRYFTNGSTGTIRIQEEDPDIIPHYIDVNKTIPSVYQGVGVYIFDEWINKIKQTYPDDYLISWKTEIDYYQQIVVQVAIGNQVVFLRSGRTVSHEATSYELSTKQKKYIKDGSLFVFTDYDVFYSIEQEFPSKLIELLDSIAITENEKTNKIHLICQDQEIGLYTKSIPIRDGEYEFDLELHYGTGMTVFHNKQIARLSTEKKGIVLYYGDPGTGKSYYIKRLCRDLIKARKKILYLPSNMVDNLGTPGFNNFLIEWASDFEDTKNASDVGILLIIEDAERVLIDRKSNSNSDGVSNILNSTDGILNDFLNIQVLATFNTDINNIDKAITRKKRALAIKEFKKLSIEDAQKLIDHLSIIHTATVPMSLADIYSLNDTEEDDILLNNNSSTKSVVTVGYKQAGFKSGS
jgi:hypothetical protein